MDIEAFQIKITNYYSKIKSIDLPTDSSHSQRLIQFINELDFIIKFLSDNLNENVLTNYLHKAHSQQNVCPLDNLCKEVIAKLNELEPLINDNIFSLIQSSNQYLAFNQLGCVSKLS